METNNGHHVGHCVLYSWDLSKKVSLKNVFDKIVQVVKSQPLNIHLLNVLGDEIASTYKLYQARILEWVAMSYFREPSRPRDGTGVLHFWH